MTKQEEYQLQEIGFRTCPICEFRNKHSTFLNYISNWTYSEIKNHIEREHNKQLKWFIRSCKRYLKERQKREELK